MLDTANVIDRRAAAVFAVPRQRKMLLPLIAAERSLGQLARLTRTPLNLLHYHMAKFLRLGLVTIVREEARAGAAVKYYRAAARAFFVPVELMEADPGAESVSRLRAVLAGSLARGIRGAVYSHDGDGPRMRLVREERSGALPAELWMELALRESDAEALADELRALLRRFAARSGKAQHAYVVHAAVARVERHRRSR